LSFVHQVDKSPLICPLFRLQKGTIVRYSSYRGAISVNAGKAFF
jgi:hypothetical protein